MSATYTIDPAHSRVSFSVRHLMIAKVHGLFEKISGKLVYDPADPSKSMVETSIDAASINTAEPQRDAHLKSADFLDVEKYPTLEFKSTRIERNSEGQLLMIGNLTMHGTTKEVSLLVEGPSEEQKDPWGKLKIGASATGKIKRKDFGLNWNAALEAGGVLVGDEVTITLDMEFAKQA